MDRSSTPVHPADPAPEPDCPICQDTGLWTGILEMRDGTRQPWFNKPCPSPTCKAGPIAKARQEQETIDRLFGQAEIPPIYTGAELADFEPGLAQAVGRALLEKRSVLVTGPVGVGKSRLLCACLRTVMRDQQSGLFIPLPTLLTVIRASFGRRRDDDGPSERQLLDGAANVAWLGLDDLGVEVGTAWVQQEVYQLVNARYLAQRPIIGTTNLTVRELADAGRLGPRTVSRLREMCEVVTMRGEDRRLRGAR